MTPTPLPHIQPEVGIRSPSEALTASSMKQWTDPVTGLEFVWVEGGCFLMGQTEAEKRELIKEVGEEI